MSKKAKRSELIAVKVMAEQRWAYERRLEHYSYRDMASLVMRPVEAGGLGYPLSESALKGLVRGYRERMADVEAEDLDEHRARELADLDLAQRLALVAMRAAAQAEELDVTATTLYLKAGESRRKLLGLDMPVTAKVDVTVHDAVTEELNAMLSRAGRPPIEMKD